MSQTKKRIGSLFLVFCMVFTLLPMTVAAADVNALEGIIEGYNDNLTASVEGNTVTVTGTVTGATTTLELNIDTDVTVVWQASITGHGDSTNSLIILTGSGTFEVQGNITDTGGTAIYRPSGGPIIVDGGSVTSADMTTLSSMGSITVKSGTVRATGTENRAIGSNGSVTVEGGTVEAAGSGHTIDATGTVTVSGDAVVIAAGSGNAINAGGNVTVSGGVVRATTGHAISTTATVDLNGGVVFAYGSEVTDVIDSNDTDIGGDALVIWWEKPAGDTPTYVAGTDTDLIAAPIGTATAEWAKVGGESGISYENGSNSGFLAVEGVTVNEAPTGGGTITGKMDINGTTAVSDLGSDAGDLATNGWAWDAGSATLTLSGNPDGPIYFDTTDSVNLVLTADVTIADTALGYAIKSGGNLIIDAGSFTLTVSSSHNETTSGFNNTIRTGGDLTITGGTVNAERSGNSGFTILALGSVTIENGAVVTALYTGVNGAGIFTSGSILITDSSTVTATGKGGSNANALRGGTGITISGSANVIASSADGGTFAIFVPGGDLTVSGSASLNSAPIDNSDIEVHYSISINTTGTVTAKCVGSYPAITASSGTSIQSGTVGITGDVSGDLTVSGGTVTVTGTVGGTTTHTGGTLNGAAPTAPTTKYNITVTGGTASPTSAAQGETVTLAAGTAPGGQRFKEWSITPAVTFVEGTSKTSQTAKFTMPNQAVTAAAVFEAIPAGTITVTGVTLNQVGVSLYSNTTPNTVTLTATVAPADATNKSVAWSSGNTSVATVDQSGKITAVSNGTAVITVTTTDGGYTASCTVTVSTYTSGGGDSGGGGGGSNSNDSKPATPPTSENVSTDGSVSQTQIAQEAAAALGAATGNTATVRTQNAQSITPAALGALADAAAKAGKKVVLHADTMQGNAVQGRLYIQPEALLNAKDPIKLGIYTEPAKTAATTSLFEKYFDNKVATVSFEQQGSFGARLEVAVKVDLTGMDVTKLVLYSYDKATNTYKRIEKPAYWIDANGYMHFTTELAGDIIISNGPLAPIKGGAK